MSDRSETPQEEHEQSRNRREFMKNAGAATAAVGIGSYFSSPSGNTATATSPITSAPPIARWTFDSGDRTLTESQSGAETTVQHRSEGEPLWIGDADGTSLLFDGYTTHATYDLESLRGLETLDQLTVDAWVAPRSFSDSDEPDTIVESGASGDRGAFRFGADTYGAWSFGVRRNGDWDIVAAFDDLLPRYEWSHLTAVFDGADGSMALYLDGALVESQSIGTGPLELGDTRLSLGRNEDTTVIPNAEMFEFDLFDGAMGQLELYDVALDEETVVEKHAAERDGVRETDWEELVVHPDRYDDDPHRPEYHAIPPQHWMNEPHAPLYYEPDDGDGRYHLFYQHNPKGPYWHHIHWGHWVSDDLVHWEPLPAALAPEPDALDALGCWAGDVTLDSDGDPAALYTVGISGDEESRPDQSIARAFAADPDDPELREWEKDGADADDLVLPAPPNPDEGASPYPSWWFDEHPDAEYPPHFRDPHVWQQDGQWFCLVGGAEYDEDDNERGTAWVYRSEDFETWEYEGQILPDEVTPNEDPFPVDEWELPVLLPLPDRHPGRENARANHATGWDADKHLLCVNALWHVEVPDWADVPSLNSYDIFYWIGEWDPDRGTFVPDHEEPRLIDYGDAHFTGCSGMVDANPDRDRSVLFTISQDYRLPEFHYEAGWAHNAGLPVELFRHDDGQLGIEPIDELESLRREKRYEAKNAAPADVNSELSEISADTVEIRLEMEARDADQYGLRLRRTADGHEETYVYYDEPSGTINVDRRASSADPELLWEENLQSDLVHSGSVDLEGERLELRVFVDKSMVECYVNSRHSVTTRTYPERSDADGLRIFHAGDVLVRSLEIWELASTSDAL